MTKENTKNQNNTSEMILFTIGDLLCGLDIHFAQEINRNLNITPVSQTPSYVRGVLNLRGKIITVIDLRVKFELDPTDILPTMRIIVVHRQGEGIGLLVDQVHDIVTINKKDLQPPPLHIGEVQGAFFSFVYKTNTHLAGIIDLEKILEPDKQTLRNTI